jgi:hypothetical protein
MTPEAKLEFVREQMVRMWEEKRELEISCPYCLSVVPAGSSACCGTLERAVNAILENQEIAERLERAYRIAEKAQKG